MNRRACLELIVLAHFCLLTEVTSKIFNKISHNQRPTQPPFQSININKAEERCFSLCSHNTKCYSILIDMSNTDAFECLPYNTTINYLQLQEKDDTRKSVFYSAEMRDCLYWYNIGARETGIYTIILLGGFSKRVRCNMEIEGGGWLVFQYRHNGEVNFQRNWKDYKQGLGSLDKEFWLGNDFLYDLTTQYDQRRGRNLQTFRIQNRQ